MSGQVERHEPLYLKYRPQILSDLVGQAAVVRTLANAIESKRIAHAYLFTGPRGTGKTSSARILAKSLNCEHGPTASPCLTCTACDEIRTSRSPGVFEIDAASNNSVDDARQLIERAPLVAVSGRFKVYIIDECHMLTKEAFNALLKTIEEPPPAVIFVLATTEEHKVPLTIVSRCQRLIFRLVSEQDLIPHLHMIADKEGIEIDKEAIELIARRSGGALRDALGLLDQAGLLASPGKPASVSDLLSLLGALHEDVLLEASRYILERQGQLLLKLINRLLLEGREPGIIALELARHFLSLTKASYAADQGGNVELPQAASYISGSPAYISVLISQAILFERGELSAIVEQLDKLEQSCRRSTQPALNLEMGLLSICHRHDIVLVKEMEARVRRLEESLLSDSTPGAVRPAAKPSAEAPVVLPVAAQALQQTEESGSASSPPGASRTVVDPPVANAPVMNQQVTAWSEAHPLAGDLPDTNQPVTDQPVGNHMAANQVVAGVTAAIVPGHLESVETFDVSNAAPGSLHPGEQSSGEPEIDLDQFWSDFLSELQKVNIPAYSVLTEHAFPLAVRSGDCLIGVRSESFQTTVEKRASKIEAACQAVLGRSVVVKVKVVNDVNAGVAKVSPRSGTSGARQISRPSSLSPGGTSHLPGGFVSDPGPASARQNVSAAVYSKPAAGSHDAPPALNEHTEVSDPGAAGSDCRSENDPRVIVGKGASSVLNEQQSIFDASTIRDAYKVFEGPGSRLII